MLTMVGKILIMDATTTGITNQNIAIVVMIGKNNEKKNFWIQLFGSPVPKIKTFKNLQLSFRNYNNRYADSRYYGREEPYNNYREAYYRDSTYNDPRYNDARYTDPRYNDPRYVNNDSSYRGNGKVKIFHSPSHRTCDPLNPFAFSAFSEHG